MNGRSIELIDPINIFQDIQGPTNILGLTDILELIQAGILLLLAVPAGLVSGLRLSQNACHRPEYSW